MFPHKKVKSVLISLGILQGIFSFIRILYIIGFRKSNSGNVLISELVMLFCTILYSFGVYGFIRSNRKARTYLYLLSGYYLIISVPFFLFVSNFLNSQVFSYVILFIFGTSVFLFAFLRNTHQIQKKIEYFIKSGKLDVNRSKWIIDLEKLDKSFQASENKKRQVLNFRLAMFMFIGFVLLIIVSNIVPGSYLYINLYLIQTICIYPLYYSGKYLAEARTIKKYENENNKIIEL